jgi:hypothetical protein
MTMINDFKQARFVLNPASMVVLALGASLVLFLQVQASKTQTVHEAGVACTVTEFEASQDRLVARMACVTQSGLVNTQTQHGKTVMQLLTTRPSQFTCDLYVAGNVGNCVVPEATTHTTPVPHNAVI